MWTSTYGIGMMLELWPVIAFETIYDFINLVDWLSWNLLIRNSLRKRHVIKLVASPTNLIFQGVSLVQVQLHTMPGS